MATATKTVTELPAWKALSAHFQKIDRLHLRELFAQDPKRGERLTVEAAGVYLDYSKNRITDETLALLLQLAEQSGLRARIDAMFDGEKINVSEKRAVLHVALRASKGQSILVDGEDVLPQVHSVLDRVADFSNRVRGGAWRGHAGKPIRNIVNIGIGGSDLGPVMAYEALEHYSDRAMTFRFVSNVDGTDFVEAIRDLDPAETLFIILAHRFTRPMGSRTRQGAGATHHPGTHQRSRTQIRTRQLDQRIDPPTSRVQGEVALDTDLCAPGRKLLRSIKKRGGTHATRNDRPRPNGRQYGATTCPTWSPMCRLRHVAERRCGTGEGQRDGKRLAGGFREEARKAARDLVDGSGSSRG
jgi:Phosphoglucose isomerase